MKKVLVAGIKDYNNFEELSAFLEKHINKLKKESTLVFISDGSEGVAKLGLEYASKNGFQSQTIKCENAQTLLQQADYIFYVWEKVDKTMLLYLDYSIDTNTFFKSLQVNLPSEKDLYILKQTY